jgi:hypothetical protein
MGLSNRIWTAATVPVVRTVGPMLANVAKTFVQFVVIMALACLVLIGVWFAGAHGIPERVIKSAAMFLGLIPMAFALLIVAEQVRITYTKPKEIVYPSVEAFPDREPT